MNSTRKHRQPADDQPLTRTIELAILIAILLAAVLLRALYLREAVADPRFEHPGIDAGYHDYWATGLATDDWTVPRGHEDPHIRTTPYLRPPGYPYFLSAVYRVAGVGPLSPRVVQMLLGLGNCVLAFVLAKRWGGQIVGLITAGLMAFYWVFVYFEGELLAPVLLVGLTLALLNVLALWIDRITVTRAVAAGLLTGAAALVRPNVLIFSPVALIWGLWLAGRRKQLRSAGVPLLSFAVAVILSVAPAVIRNYRVSGDFVLITANLGINLYIGNSEVADGCVVDDLPGLGRFATCFDYRSVVRSVQRQTGRPLSDSEVSRYFAGKALRYIADHPLHTLALMGRKALLFWGPMEISNNKVIHYEREHSPVLRNIPGNFATALAVGVAGCAMFFVDWAGQRRRDPPAQVRRRYRMTILILLFVLSYFVSYLPFFVAGRYRVAIIPFLLLFGAYAIWQIGRLVRLRRPMRAALWLGAVVLLYGLSSRNAAGYQPNQARWHYDRGIAYRSAGDTDHAIEQYRQAIAIDPSHSSALYNLGLALAAQDRLDEAITQYRRALAIRPDHADAHNNLGNALLRQGKLDEAIEHYHQALEIWPDYALAHRNLGLALVRRGQADQAVVHFQQAVQIDPDYAAAHQNLADALSRTSRFAEAADHYTAVLRLAPDHIRAMNDLAWLLATCPDAAIRSGPEAVRLATEANRLLNYTQPLPLDTLAAAYAEVGDFDRATAAARRAVELARAHNQSELADQYEARLRLYRARQAYRQPAP